MYAPRRSDVDDLNRRARQHLRAAGLLGDVTIVVAGRQFASGDEVLFLRNDRRLGVRNGTHATITSLGDDGSITVTGPGNAEAARSIPAGYLAEGNLTLGYATTIHKAQGATVDRAFLLGSDALYREAGYVGLSRARYATNLYLVDGGDFVRHGGLEIPAEPTVELAARLSQSRAQLLAFDQLPPPTDTGRRRVERDLGRDDDLGMAL